MTVSKKTRYALRALLELSTAYGKGPQKIAAVADEQAIPPRFLEVILCELKQAGFVDSRRGSAGGYFLTRNPEMLSVGEVIRFVEGPIGPASCANSDSNGECCPEGSDCVFQPMWERAKDAISEVYDSTTFADLVKQTGKIEASAVAETPAAEEATPEAAVTPPPQPEAETPNVSGMAL